MNRKDRKIYENLTEEEKSRWVGDEKNYVEYLILFELIFGIVLLIATIIGIIVLSATNSWDVLG